MVEDVILDVNGKPLKFKNDPRLRPAGVKLAYTQEQAMEYIRCKEDIVYFIETYCKILDPNKGFVLPKLYEWQKRLLITLQNNRFVIIKVGRQSGKSTTLMLFNLWCAIFVNDGVSGIFAQRLKTAGEIFSKIFQTYRALPHFLKPGIREFNKTSIHLDNGKYGSRIYCDATTADGARGFTITQNLMIDEVAAIRSNLFQKFMDSTFPVVSRADNSRIVLIGTPSGLNHFYKFWKEAKAGISDFIPVEVAWDETPGRDEAFKKKIIDSFGLEYWLQEFECEFLGTAMSLIKSGTMKELPVVQPIRTMMDGHLRVYEDYQPGCKYVLTCDVSEGVDQDASVVNVFRLEPERYVQVAVYQNSEVELNMFHHVVYACYKLYGGITDSLIIIENNSVGVVVLTNLFNEEEYGDVNLYQEPDADRLGLRITAGNRHLGVTAMKELVENRVLVVNDFATIGELSTFVKRGRRYQADSGCHDDLVMTLVHLAIFSKTEEFKELAGGDSIKDIMRRKANQMAEDELPPIFTVDSEGRVSMVDAARSSESDYI